MSSIDELARSLEETLARLLGPQAKAVTVAVPSTREIEISAAVSDLENAVTEVAKREASKHGATVEEVRLNFREIDPHSLGLEANVRAKKMFFATTVRITGKMEIDQQLTVSVSDLNCTGEGAIGSMACAFLAPQLARFNGQSFPLATFVNAEISLQDVRLSAGEKVAVTAEFAA